MLLKDVLAGVENYRLSVEQAADTTLARRVWANEPDVSLITPRGHARGYDEIENMFYIKAMAGIFSTRTLRILVTDNPALKAGLDRISGILRCAVLTPTRA